jgi:hypothetical protein
MATSTAREGRRWHSRLSTETDSTRIDFGAIYIPAKPPSLPLRDPSRHLAFCRIVPLVPLRAGKSGKQIERCVISSFQIADSMAFKGDFRQGEDLLRVGE